MTESFPEVRRPEGRGIDVLPLRVRRARQDAGLTLAQLAEGKVSRTAIHLIETGRSRPSPQTLAHIARRTGKPVSYFLGATAGEPEPSPGDVARQTEDLMRQAAWKLARLLRHGGLDGTERVALEGVLLGVRHGMRLIQTLHSEAWEHDRPPPAPAAPDPTPDDPAAPESYEEPRRGGALDLE